MSEPFIVMCAPNGARRDKNDHSAIPLIAGELADCAASILAAGASMIHVHVRDHDNQHTLDAGRYRAAQTAISERVGNQLVVQVTTEACGIYSREQQMAVVRELRPEAVSVALNEICPDESAEREAADFYRWMQDESVMAQHILYSADDVARFESFRSRGLIPDERPFVLFVLGRYSEKLAGEASDLAVFVESVSNETTWSVCCFGAAENEAVKLSAQTGGHARVGFENNLSMPDGSRAVSNDALVTLAVKGGVEHGRQPATADQVRELLGVR